MPPTTGGAGRFATASAPLTQLLAAAVLLLHVPGSAAAAAASSSLGAGRGWNAPALDSLPPSDLLDLGGGAWSVRATAGPGATNCRCAPVRPTLGYAG